MGAPALGAVVAGLALQAPFVPPILAGASLAVVEGLRPDPHLLSALPFGVAMRACASGASCVHILNLAALALLALLFGLIAATAVRRARPLFAAIATALILMSPLAVAGILDPLGTETFFSLGLLALAAADLAGLTTWPFAARCVLVTALTLQEPALVPAAAAYGLLVSGRGKKVVLIAVAAVVFLLRWLMQRDVGIEMLPSIDSVAAPPTIIAIGLVLFVCVPVALVFANQFPLFFSRARGNTRKTLFFAAGCLAIGIFARTGDPSPYWLAAEGAALFAFLAWRSDRSKPGPQGGAVLGIALLVQIGILAIAHKDIPSVVIAHQTATLYDDLAIRSSPLCVVADPSGFEHVLAGGAALRRRPNAAARVEGDITSCIADTPPSEFRTTRLTTVRGLYVDSWGAALPLAETALAASAASLSLTRQPGSVYPATPANTPTHKGAFLNIVTTPVGPLDDIAIVPGYAYTFFCLTTRAASTLTFAAAQLPGAPALRIEISLGKMNATRSLVRATIPGTAVGGASDWHRFSAPIPALACTNLTVAVSNPKGGSGPWLTIAGMAIR